MIQRIQSVFLILAIVFAGFFITGNLFKFTGDTEKEYLMNTRGIFQVAPETALSLEKNTPFLFVLSVSLPLVLLLSVFLFKNRKLQMKVLLILLFIILLLAGLAVFYGIMFARHNLLKQSLQFEIFIPLVNFVLVILAYRGVKKDEDLVRSYDRLR
ncbi:MAG: DUF4293 domain-containing protein [Bacteroidales bacterium]|jgi:hypothetical protein|nr:DUF4293 domain-containing protein [Bacteroidales bacterium]